MRPSGAARAAALLEKGEPAGALLAWAETRRVFQDSGAANAGFQLNDPDSIPAELLPEIMGALTFLEWAIAGIINDEIEASQRELETCIARLTAIAGKCQAPDGKLRLEQTVRRLREAAGKLAQNDTDSADRLMRTELYISP